MSQKFVIHWLFRQTNSDWWLRLEWAWHFERNSAAGSSYVIKVIEPSGWLGRDRNHLPVSPLLVLNSCNKALYRMPEWFCRPSTTNWAINPARQTNQPQPPSGTSDRTTISTSTFSISLHSLLFFPMIFGFLEMSSDESCETWKCDVLVGSPSSRSVLPASNFQVMKIFFLRSLQMAYDVIDALGANTPCHWIKLWHDQFRNNRAEPLFSCQKQLSSNRQSETAKLYKSFAISAHEFFMWP